MNIDITHDQVDSIVKNALVEMLEVEKNPEIVNAMNIIIAYFSVPQTWANGEFDKDSII